jgi:hypothetical protein
MSILKIKNTSTTEKERDFLLKKEAERWSMHKSGFEDIDSLQADFLFKITEMRKRLSSSSTIDKLQESAVSAIKYEITNSGKIQTPVDPAILLDLIK